MDMGFLLVSSMLWSWFSISYSFPIPLGQFANNILVGLYLGSAVGRDFPLRPGAIPLVCGGDA
jgi:hypothetical protein